MCSSDLFPSHDKKICEEYAGKDTRIRVFHQQNSGVSAARNIGLQHAKGTYIVFVDSDDWVSTDYLLHLYKSLEINRAVLLVHSLVQYS